MPQNGMNYEGRRRGTRHISCKANGQVNGQVPGTDLVNGAVFHNGFPAAATRTRERTPAGSQNGTRPQSVVNGYFNHDCKVKSKKAVQPRTSRKQGSRISAVHDASASGRVISAGIPGGVSVNGDAVSLPCNPDQGTPEPSLPAAAKSQRRWKKFRHKKRNDEMLPTMPQEEEDWEKEIQEVTLTGWDKLCFGICPYGPQDVLHFALRDLTLKQRDTVDLPVTATYSPSIHHPRPVRWSCYNIPTETDQFADADDE